MSLSWLAPITSKHLSFELWESVAWRAKQFVNFACVHVHNVFLSVSLFKYFSDSTQSVCVCAGLRLSLSLSLSVSFPLFQSFSLSVCLSVSLSFPCISPKEYLFLNCFFFPSFVIWYCIYIC